MIFFKDFYIFFVSSSEKKETTENSDGAKVEIMIQIGSWKASQKEDDKNSPPSFHPKKLCDFKSSKTFLTT